MFARNQVHRATPDQRALASRLAIVLDRGYHMSKKLYVGNIDYAMTDGELQQLFEPFGTVASAQVIRDRVTGRSKGFGFVEMVLEPEAQAAITALNGQESRGRTLTVDGARPREERNPSFSGARARRY